MEYSLRPGTVLDDRYRIASILGEGGFGITYAAENTRIGLKVAVKELFWRGHSTRDALVSPEVALSQPEDAPVFAEQKDRFLREARILRDFSGEACIVRVLDYFEANETAYIVMEYVDGQTLNAWVEEKGGRVDAETMLRLILPLIDSLGRVHAGGVIHRDISPDNIMVQPDGSLKLIDFGAARAYLEGAPRYTTVAKVSYAPGEQYDKNGRQGPWTDVYALCATLYHAVTGTPPDSAVQRLFLDELKAPSERGVPIDPAYESIIMKGLSLSAGKRYQSMEELAAAIRTALPEEKPQKARASKRQVALGFLAGAACIALVLAFILYRQYDAAHKFRGIATERARITPQGNMSAQDFAESQVDFREKLDEFAGKDNYIMRVDGVKIDLTMPLSLFGGKMIAPTLSEALSDGESERQFWLEEEIQANWEDPAASLTPGENQILPASFDEQTMVFAFSFGNNAITRGQRANLITDMKTRLDALDTPYAFGTLYGNDNIIVIRLSPRRVGRFMLETLGKKYLYICGESRNLPNSMQLHYESALGASELSVFRTEKGTYGLRYETKSNWKREEIGDMTQTLLQNGFNKLYLQDFENYAVAELTFDKPITDGILEFRDIRFIELGDIDDEDLWILNYVDALMNETYPPIECSMYASRLLDAEGNTLFGEMSADLYGLHANYKDNDIALREALSQIYTERGYGNGMSADRERYWLYLNLPLDDRFVETAARLVPELIETYGLSERCRSGPGLIIQLLNEIDNERCRVILNGGYDHDTATMYPEISFLCWESERLAPYKEALKAWWEGFDAEALGLVKD